MHLVRLCVPLLLLGCASSRKAPPEPAPRIATLATVAETTSEGSGRGTGQGGMLPPPTPISAEDAQRAHDAALEAVAANPGERSVVTLEDGATEVALWSWTYPRLILSEAVCAPDGVLASCLALDAVRDIQTQVVEVGPGNPATYYCEPAGGTPTTATSEAGQSGLCGFSDGSYVADWSLIYVPRFGQRVLQD